MPLRRRVSAARWGSISERRAGLEVTEATETTES